MAPKYNRSRDNERVVYSSEQGRMCPTCNKPVAKCRCKQTKAAAARPATDGVVRVRREKKGRGGKVVTTVEGVPGTEAEVKAIAKKLKQRCGVGGSFKDWIIIVQGDQCDTVVAELIKLGMDAKRAGG